MRTRRRLLTTTIAVLTVPFAVAAVASAASAAPAAPAAHVMATTTSTVVVTTEHTKFGTVLETSAGESLYVFSGDNQPFSAANTPQLACTALNVQASIPCTTAWPPLVATGKVVAAGGVNQKLLGTITRNNVKQVTYNHLPLYGFINDTKAHAVNGEDVGAFFGTWYLLHTNALASVTVPTVSEEVSPNGVILASAVANGTRTLYLLTADTPKTSNCNAAGACDAFWPPLLTSVKPNAGNGVNRGLFGSVRRHDGNLQVTYAGHPLYFFALDLGVTATNGETNGEHILDPAPVDGVWYTVLPDGMPEPGSATIQSEMIGGTNILSDLGAVNGVDATLYAFTRDTPAMSNCNTLCAMIWPPVLTQTAPSAIDAANGSLLGVIQRRDGTFQVTYKGHPLYYFAPALITGNTSGNGVRAFGGTFDTVNVSGALG